MAQIPPLAELESNNPPLAGQIIRQMSADVLNHGKLHGASTALAKQLYPDNWENARSKVTQWCNGNFINDHGALQPSDFQRIVEILWNKPGGIQNKDDFWGLVHCVGKIKWGDGKSDPTLELADMLDKKWLARLGLSLEEIAAVNNVPLRDYRYPHTRLNIRRDEIEQKIFDIFRLAQVSNQCVVIYGQPGVGKTKLIEQLAVVDWGNQFELKKVFYLNGKEIYNHLSDWYKEQVGIYSVQGIRLDDLIVELKIKLMGKKIIVFMDDVANAKSANQVIEILDKAQSSLLIITTNSQSTVREIGTPPQLVLTLDGFSFDEAKEFFEIAHKTKLANHQLEDFRTLRALLKGNPLGLHFAFIRLKDVGLSNLVQLLASSDLDTPTGMLREIFLPLEIGYERLPDYLKRAFALLGAAGQFVYDDEETLSFIFCPKNEAVNIPKTKQLIRDIQTAMSPFIFDADDKTFTLHQQTHLFALSKFRQLSIEEQIFANQWQDRMYSAHVGEFKIISFAEALRLKTSKDFSEQRPVKRNLIQKIQETGEMLILIKNYEWEMAKQYKEFFTPHEYMQIRFVAEKESRNFRIIRLGFFAFLIAWLMAVIIPWLKYPALIAFGAGILLMPFVIWAWLENYKFVIHWAIIWKEINRRKENN